MKQHVSSVRTNVRIFTALMILLFVTVGAAYLPLGPLHFPTAMAIATAKSVLIVLYFMHVKYSHRLTAIICSAAFLWLGIMIALILTDYMTRSPTEWHNWVNIPGK
jgi:cytochrome c oxidase subunit IV